MTRLTWTPIEREYETGLDRGVLYFGQNEAVAWDGLVRVQEQTTPSVGAPLYFDGVCFNLEQEISDYAAKVEAYIYPYMLDDHILAMMDGRTLVGDLLELMPFGFTYRTRYGSGYRIHLVYNIVASVESINNETIGQTVQLTPFAFTFNTNPVEIPGAKPTSHIYVDTTEADEGLVFQLENLLYGSDETHPRFPTVDEVVSLFAS